MIEGVKANDYNATWENVVFDIISRGALFEIREMNSGTTFFIEKGAFSDKGRSEKRAARFEGDVKGHTGGIRRDRKDNGRGYKNDDRI